MSRARTLFRLEKSQERAEEWGGDEEKNGHPLGAKAPGQTLVFLPFFFFLIYLFYFFGCVGTFFGCVAAHELSLVAESEGYSSLRCTGFSLRWLLLLRSTGSRRAGFSSCGARALEHRLSSCGARA